jgi:hypothetical protein
MHKKILLHPQRILWLFCDDTEEILSPSISIKLIDKCFHNSILAAESTDWSSTPLLKLVCAGETINPT